MDRIQGEPKVRALILLLKSANQGCFLFLAILETTLGRVVGVPCRAQDVDLIYLPLVTLFECSSPHQQSHSWRMAVKSLFVGSP
ncbi:hypothetical protein LZ30DRAFT_284112 [Colletotrichum cereale]|nr:hypothetical protein LZ30DRAFT_284112 [Colletotrichum cereale]